MNCLFRLLLFCSGLLILFLWYVYLDDRLKGVVFFWFIPLLGGFLIIASIAEGGDKEKD